MSKNKFANKNAIPYDEDYIRKNFDKYTLIELSKKLSKRIGVEVTPKNLSRKINKMGLSKFNKLDKSQLKEDEKFKNIKGFSNYKISQYGTIFNIKTKIVLKPEIDRNGYYIIKLVDDNGKTKTKTFHNLIAMAWIKNDDPLNKVDVDHKDGNKLNNSINNLEWVTKKENLIRARKNGLNKSIPNHKQLSLKKIKRIYLYKQKHPEAPLTVIARKYNISPMSVKRIIEKTRYSYITNILDKKLKQKRKCSTTIET